MVLINKTHYNLNGELIHLPWCVKVNLYFNPGIVLIVLSGTETNHQLNFTSGLQCFNCGLVLISF